MKKKGEGDRAGAVPRDKNKEPGRSVSEPQMALYDFEPVDSPIADRAANGKANKVDPQDRAFHEWYRFVLSYPPHLVRHYLQDFSLNADRVVLDPFCGTGTTLVEAKRRGVPSIGLEANPFAQFASSVKTDWDVDPGAFEDGARRVGKRALELLQQQDIVDGRLFKGDLNGLELRRLPPESAKLLLTDSISPLPLHKTLVLLDCMRELEAEPYHRHVQLALANALVYSISNLHFGPEVGVGKPKQDAPVVSAWLAEISKMAADLRAVRGQDTAKSTVHLADARQAKAVLDPKSVDGVITSPPYPNEKDYTGRPAWSPYYSGSSPANRI